MIECMMVCLLNGKAQDNTNRSGGSHRLVSANVRVQMGQRLLSGTVVAATEAAQAKLMSLNDGDAVVLAGALSPKAFLDGQGSPLVYLELIATAAMTLADARINAPGTQRGSAG